MNKEEYLKSLHGTEVAIIGYALRFPGASSGEAFWQNLVRGEESVRFFTDEELTALNVSPDTYQQKQFVRAVVKDIEHKEYFDYSFFDYTPEEAKVMDPQMRVFHELVWEAMEHSGQASQAERQKIGLFAGAASSFSHELLGMAAGLDQRIGTQIASRLANKDYFCSRTAYALNLKGPCFTIQTACSTSLVAVHVAVRSLLTGECKMALAGGISIQPEKNNGYIYDEGGVLSSDGHCRAFDASSSGTIFGEGGCVVMLKRLKDAIQDNDTIHAVIKGSAVNNDGNRKVGFTAPSIEGQVDVIRLAHKIARVEPESIQYIEAHGTGTKLGDPIELQALHTAFGSSQKQFCAIGSVKTNVGHLDTAAGIAGLMKVILALKHRQIPPSLHYKTPNPNFDFENSPFFVNQALSAWNGDSALRRAGVSSFGIGGTNAHMVVEEAPVFDAPDKSSPGSYHIIPVSARTTAALKKLKVSLAEFLKREPAPLHHVSFTLQRGRKHFAFRDFMIAGSGQEITEAWGKEDDAAMAQAGEPNVPVVFMFGGQGSQYWGITRDLYRNFAPYKKEVDLCLACLPSSLKDEILAIMLCNPADPKDMPQIPTRVTQPLLFIMEHALARVLMAFGVTPDAMIGHSIGEYVAACISGVMSLEDALDLVVFRGEIMEQSREGAMLSVNGPAGTWEHLPDGEVSIAAINSRSSRVLSGPADRIRAIEQQLAESQVACRRLHTNKAFHSVLMEEALPLFMKKLEGTTLTAPRIPYISNLTGKFIRPEEAMDPAYWVKHLRHTVEFAKGLDELGQVKKRIFIEIGTAKNLSTFVKDQLGPQVVIDLVRHPKADVPDEYFFLNGIAALWRAGKAVMWEKIESSETSRKIPLPLYPFERSRFWNDTSLSELLHKKFKALRPHRRDELAYIPAWRRSIQANETAGAARHLVIIGDESPEMQAMMNCWRTNGHKVMAGGGFDNDHQTWFDQLKQEGITPDVVLFFVGDDAIPGDAFAGGRAEARLVNLLKLFRACSQVWDKVKVEIKVITSGSQEVIGEDVTTPWSAALAGFVKVCALEYKNLKCALVDVDKISFTTKHVKHLATALSNSAQEVISAWRRGYRWTLNIEPAGLSAVVDNGLTLPGHPVILITGGAGATGIALARHFIKKYHADIALVGLSALPARETWEDWKLRLPEDDAVRKKIEALLALETGNSRVLYYHADISDLAAMQSVMTDVDSRLGNIHGVVHAAGSAERSALELMDGHTVHQQLRAKAAGVFVLEKLLAGRELCFFVNYSSLNAIKPFFGQGGYAAANAVLEAFCHSHTLQCDAVKTISWDTFNETGMAVQTENDLFDNLHACRFDIDHPLVTYRAQNRNGHDVIVSYLSPDLWVLNEHCVVRQKPTLPAKAYVEVLYAALRTLHPGQAIEIGHLLISSPLVVETSGIRVMKTVLEKRDDRYIARIVSRTGRTYQEHARAEARVLPVPERLTHDIGSLVKDGVEKYLDAEPSGTQAPGELGPRWHNLKWIRIGDREGISRLELGKDFRDDTSAFLLHPAMVDMASGFLYMARKDQRSTYLPYYYEQIFIYDRIPSACYSHVTLKSESGESLTFDVRLLDECGRELMFIGNYTYKTYTKPSIGARPDVPLPVADTVEKTVVEKQGTRGLTTAQMITWLEKAISSTHRHLIISKQNCETISFGLGEDPAADEAAEAESKDDILLRERPGMTAAFVEAVTPTQKMLAEDWQRFFGIKQVGILDDFFELGGDSLKSTTIISRINKTFRVAVSLTEFFKNSTVKKLAEYIDRSSQSDTGLCVPKKAEKKSFYPLSPSQKRIFFLQQVYKDPTAYNITEAFKLKGALDRERIEQAITALLQRHDSLRTRLVMVNNTPYQQILESVQAPIAYHRVDESEIRTALYAFRQPFDLDKPPYIRFGVFQTEKNDHYLIVDILHLVADGTSLLILIKEFWDLYHQATLAPAPLSHIDFAEWQVRLQRSGRFEKQRAFWRQYLSGEPALVKLPFDSPPLQGMENAGRNESIILSKETTAALRAIVRRHEATEFMLMVALFHTFLGKLTGQRDIITGIPTAGRTHEEFNASVGMFVNTTLIRSMIDPGEKFSDVLMQVKRNTLAVFDHQDLQYEMIMDMVRQESGRPVTSLFNVILNYRNMFVSGEINAAKDESIHGTSASLEDTSAKHDLVLFIYDNADHFSITCNYPTALFNPETITFMMKEFTHLSDQVAQDHERAVSAYDIFRKEAVLTAAHQAAVFDL